MDYETENTLQKVKAEIIKLTFKIHMASMLFLPLNTFSRGTAAPKDKLKVQHLQVCLRYLEAQQKCANYRLKSPL